MIRHGEPDYSPCEERGFIGHGNDLSALCDKGIKQIKKTAGDERLKNAEIIISSPYTRTMHTSAIISKELELDIKVEIDLHEWLPDKTFKFGSFKEYSQLRDEFDLYRGKYPKDEEKQWEEFESVKKRVKGVLEKYKNYDCVIVVCHAMVMKTVKYKEKYDFGEILEFEI